MSEIAGSSVDSEAEPPEPVAVLVAKIQAAAARDAAREQAAAALEKAAATRDAAREQAAAALEKAAATRDAAREQAAAGRWNAAGLALVGLSIGAGLALLGVLTCQGLTGAVKDGQLQVRHGIARPFISTPKPRQKRKS